MWYELINENYIWKKNTYFLTADMVSLFLNLRNLSVYVKVFIKTSENSCSSSADSFWSFLCSNSIWTSEISNVSAFSNSKISTFQKWISKNLRVQKLLRWPRTTNSFYIKLRDFITNNNNTLSLRWIFKMAIRGDLQLTT